MIHRVTLSITENSFLKRININLVIVILALHTVGLINLYSATHGLHTSGLSRLFLTQVVWICVGWMVFFAATFINFQFWRKASYFIYAINVIALIAVVFVGHKFYGAQRWLDLGFFHYQPSETIKLALVLVLAAILSKKRAPGGLNFKQLLGPLTLTLIPFVLIVNQPDLGTSLMLMAIATSMLLFVKMRKNIILGALLVTLVGLPLAWNFGLKRYQKDRILTFIEPGRDPRGTGYNSIQSKIAVGSGKFLGKGFRKGTQSQLEFLPERHTDFIFSVLSEEHGFLGGITTVGLFLMLFITAIRIASEAREKFAALIVIGQISFIFWHTVVNIGMVTGLLPIVGIPLPLISYGGSSMIATMLSLGIISGVAYRRKMFTT